MTDLIAILKADLELEAKATPLLPCPFCGETPDYDDQTSFNGEADSCKWGAVQCGCGVQGPDVRTHYSTDFRDWRDEAAKEWNQRVRNHHRAYAEFALAAAEWKCPACEGSGTALGRKTPEQFNESVRSLVKILQSRPCEYCTPIRQALTTLEEALSKEAQ